MNSIDSMILNMSYDMKIKLLEDALKEDKLGIFLQISKVLLDAPISKGGIPSEVFQAISDKYEQLN